MDMEREKKRGKWGFLRGVEDDDHFFLTLHAYSRRGEAVLPSMVV